MIWNIYNKSFTCILAAVFWNVAFSSLSLGDTQIDKSIQLESLAAYCLGVTEESLSLQIQVMRLGAKNPNLDVDKAKKEATARLASMQQIIAYLAKMDLLSGKRDPFAILDARQNGLLDAQACLREQRAYAACVSQCQANKNTRYSDPCGEKCKAPEPCRSIQCKDIESKVLE